MSDEILNKFVVTSCLNCWIMISVDKAILIPFTLWCGFHHSRENHISLGNTCMHLLACNWPFFSVNYYILSNWVLFGKILGLGNIYCHTRELLLTVACMPSRFQHWILLWITAFIWWEFPFLQIAFTSLVYPSLVLAYMGQAAYLSRHHIIESDYRIGFYVSVPGRYLELYSLKTLRFG